MHKPTDNTAIIAAAGIDLVAGGAPLGRRSTGDVGIRC